MMPARCKREPAFFKKVALMVPNREMPSKDRVRWLIKQIQEFKKWLPLGPDSDWKQAAQADLYKSVFYTDPDNRGNLRLNNCLQYLWMGIVFKDAKPSACPQEEQLNRLLETLMDLGVDRDEAIGVGIMDGVGFSALDRLSRPVDPPNKENSRSILDAVVDGLEAKLPPLPKPNREDCKRYKAQQCGASIKEIARCAKVSNKAVEKSLTKVRRWREYEGIPEYREPKRGRRTRHILEELADRSAHRPDELAED
jgi:hypothetical protein